MKAAVYRGINDVRVEEVATPEIGSKEVLVKVEACGVCGTDLKKIEYGLRAPCPRVCQQIARHLLSALRQSKNDFDHRPIAQ